MAHYLAPCLAILRSQVNALAPGRDRASDGWIGDTSHQARKSDHNPDRDSVPPGIVRALDIDDEFDGKGRGDASARALALLLVNDHRVAYVIHEHRIGIRNAKTGRVVWSKYSGANPHTQHVHVSIRHGRTFENDLSPWPMPGPVGVIRPGTGASITPSNPTPQEEDEMNKDQDAALAYVYETTQRMAQILEALDVRTGNPAGNLATAARQIADIHGRVNFARYPDGTPMRIAVQGDVDAILRAVAGVSASDVDEAAVAAAVVALLPAGVVLDPKVLAAAVVDATADRLKAQK